MEQKKYGALALQLDRGGTLTIGDEILITLDRCSTNQAKLIIKAPKHLNIQRYRAASNAKGTRKRVENLDGN